MKKLITSALVCTFAAYLSGLSVYAQGRGPSHDPAGPVGGAHGNNSDHHAVENKTDGPFESRIESNPQLKSRVAALLPAGMDLKTAAMGFRNQGQFIAALHVSKNLNIPFDQLKAKLTGDHSESLGKAIHDLRPDFSEMDAKAQADIAEKQAKDTQKTTTSPLT